MQQEATMITHTDDGAIRGIAHLAAADATARKIVVRLAQARALAAERSGGEALDIIDDADHEVALLVERYSAGGTRSLLLLIDALADVAADAWLAVGRLLETDPGEAMDAADRYRG
jgi:hypothetical protein